MSAFLKSKSALQCRSHHQKYEEKYKYPHRIIREEKDKICPNLYLHVSQSHTSIPSYEDPLTSQKKIDIKRCSSIEIQTDLQGVSTVFLTRQQYEASNYQYPSYLPMYGSMFMGGDGSHCTLPS